MRQISQSRFAAAPVPPLIIERNDFPIAINNNNAAITRIPRASIRVRQNVLRNGRRGEIVKISAEESEETAKVRTEPAGRERRKIVGTKIDLQMVR